MDPAEDERVWDTLPPSRLGWPELWHLAARHASLEPSSACFVLAPPLKSPQACAERQHMLEVRTIGLTQNNLPADPVCATYQRGPAY